MHFQQPPACTLVHWAPEEARRGDVAHIWLSSLQQMGIDVLLLSVQVFFLTCAGTKVYPDPRMTSVDAALAFAKSSQLQVSPAALQAPQCLPELMCIIDRSAMFFSTLIPVIVEKRGTSIDESLIFLDIYIVLVQKLMSFIEKGHLSSRAKNVRGMLPVFGQS